MIIFNTILQSYLAITRFFIPKGFLPHLLSKGKFSAKLVKISL